MYKSHCKTVFEKKESKLFWVLENYSLNGKSTGENVRSDFFSVGSGQAYQWYLDLFPDGEKRSDQGHLSLYLFLMSPPHEALASNFTLSLINDKDVEVFSKKYKWNFRKGDNGFGDDKFISYKVLSSMNGALVNDTLRIGCTVEYSQVGKTWISNCSEPETCSRSSLLGASLGNMLQSQAMTDVTLVAKGVELKAHKTILAARSPVFMRMFSTDMTEKETDQVHITDLEPEVVQKLLQFVYTGSCSDFGHLTVELLGAANKYDLPDLKSICESSLMSEVCRENLEVLLTVADLYSCTRLQEKLVQFCSRNIKLLQEEEDLQNILLSNPKVLLAIVKSK